MSAPTAIAPATIDPPVPNRMTRITPPPAAVKAKDNFNMAVIASIFVAAAAASFWMKHPVASYVLEPLTSYSSSPFFPRKLMLDSVRTAWRNLEKRS
jgi:hypothetical protein